MTSFRQISTAYTLSERGWQLALGEMPPVAAHLVTVRCGYMHHGIHTGNGKVVHYTGLSRSWASGPVQETTIAEFARNRPVWVRPHTNPRFDRHEIVKRAHSRLGESSYRVLSNNCEHLCEWCVQGESRSWQIEALRRTPRRLLGAVLRAIVTWRKAWQVGPDNWAV